MRIVIFDRKESVSQWPLITARIAILMAAMFAGATTAARRTIGAKRRRAGLAGAGIFAIRNFVKLAAIRTDRSDILLNNPVGAFFCMGASAVSLMARHAAFLLFLLFQFSFLFGFFFQGVGAGVMERDAALRLVDALSDTACLLVDREKRRYLSRSWT